MESAKLYTVNFERIISDVSIEYTFIRLSPPLESLSSYFVAQLTPYIKIVFRKHHLIYYNLERDQESSLHDLYLLHPSNAAVLHFLYGLVKQS